MEKKSVMEKKERKAQMIYLESRFPWLSSAIKNQTCLESEKKASGKEAKKNSESHTFGGPKVKVQPFVKVAYISDRSTYDRGKNFPSWYVHRKFWKEQFALNI